MVGEICRLSSEKHLALPPANMLRYDNIIVNKHKPRQDIRIDSAA
jgi:hypothetical protein